jgi:hypothetical protein
MLPSHLSEFTLNDIAGATTRLGETAEARTRRLAAIRAMYEGFSPRDAVEDMLISRIIILRFLLSEAVTGLALLSPDSEEMEKSRKAAGALSRTLLSWVRQLEQRRAREAKQRAEDARQLAAPGREPTSADMANGPAPPEPPCARVMAATQAIASPPEMATPLQKGALAARPMVGDGAAAGSPPAARLAGTTTLTPVRPDPSGARPQPPHG